MEKPLEPTPTLLVKLGSLFVHAEEFFSPEGHEVDRFAIDSILQDQECREWIEAMGKMALVPRKRSQN